MLELGDVTLSDRKGVIQVRAGAPNIPPHRAVLLPLSVTAGGAGEYTIEGVATSAEASDSSFATLEVIFDDYGIYLPFIARQ